MTATTTTINAILKELYPRNYVDKMLYMNNPFWGWVPKSERFVGRHAHIALQHAATAGRSTSFSVAQANRAGARYTGFDVTRVPDYSVFSLTSEAILAAENDMGALTQSTKAETDAAFNKIEQSISRSLFGNGGGAIGQIASGAGTTTLTLQNADEIVNFEVGDSLQHATTDGSSGAVGAGAATSITAVDRDLGTITAAAAWPAGFANGQYLFHEGDFGNKMSGLAAWIPSTAPTATAFFGVDRTADATRLGGVRFTGSTSTHHTLQRTFVAAGQRLMREGGRPDTIFLNPIDHGVFLNDIGDKTRFEKVPNRSSDGGKPVLSYKALCIMIGTGEVKVLADKHCPKGRAYMLQQDTWKLMSLGKCPRWLDADGKQMLREDSNDAIQGRLAMFGNLTCCAPGKNATIDISAFDPAA